MTYFPSKTGSAMAIATDRVNSNEHLLQAAIIKYNSRLTWHTGDDMLVQQIGRVAARLVCDGEVVWLVVAGSGWESIPYRFGFRLAGQDWKLSADVSVANFRQWKRQNREVKERIYNQTQEQAA